jgi:site-specific recombinase XerD
MKMKTSILINAATNFLKEQKFTEQTIRMQYLNYWEPFMKVSNLDLEIIYSNISEYTTLKYGQDLLNSDASQLNKKLKRAKHAFDSLVSYNETKTLGSTSMSNKAIRIKINELDTKYMELYLEYCQQEGNRPATLENKKIAIHDFFLSTSLLGCSDSGILEYLKSLSRMSRVSARIKMNIVRYFLRYCYEQEIISSDFAYLFPKNRILGNIGVPSVYTPEEIAKVIDYLKNTENNNTKRDYSIAVLIITYGFRAKDIFNLKITDINWEASSISIVQSKTGELLTHFLTVTAGNALTEYLLEVRPFSESDSVFLKCDGSTFGSAASISSIINLAFINSGIILNGRKHGSHCLRHSLASNMLANGAGIFNISKALGHNSVDTTRIYAKVDLKNLRLCELEVSQYE